MSSPGLLLLLLLLATPPPLQPSSLAPPDTPEGKATIMGLILSALERATSFLKKRLPEINLDGVVGFRVLEGGCTRIPLDWPVLSQSPPCSTGKLAPFGCLGALLYSIILEAKRIQKPHGKRFGNYYFPGRK